MNSMPQAIGWIWPALAIVTAGLAEQKGRSRWQWFLLGLLLGPLATALVVIWSGPKESASGASHRDVRYDFGVGAALTALAFAILAVSTGLWVAWIAAGAAAVAAALLLWLRRRVPASRLR